MNAFNVFLIDWIFNEIKHSSEKKVLVFEIWIKEDKQTNKL